MSLGLPDALALAMVCLLLGARLVPIVVIVPWLSPVSVPLVVRLGLVVGLVVALLPSALAAGVPAGVPMALVALREGLVGLTFSLAAAAPLVALQWGGELVDTWRGAAFPERTDVRLPSRPLGSLFSFLAVALFWLLGAHRVALLAFADGLHAAPFDRTVASSASVAWGAARIVADALAFAVAVAGPVLAALVIYDLAWGLAARAAGLFPATLVSMPLRALVAIVAVLLGLSFVMNDAAAAFEAALGIATELVASFAGP